MSNLQETLSKIKKAQVLADGEVTLDPQDTYRARIGRKNRALETLKDLKAVYERNLLNSAVFIVVTGDGSKDFRDLSTGAGCFKATPEVLYQTLVEEIPTSLYGREGVASLFDMVTRQLETVALDLGIVSYPQLQFKKEYSKEIKTKDEFVKLIARAINAQVGAELVGIHTIRSIVDVAIDKGHKSKDTPVVLATADVLLAKELDQGLQQLTRRVYLVAAGNFVPVPGLGVDFELSEVTQESVNKVMKTIKASLKR